MANSSFSSLFPSSSTNRRLVTILSLLLLNPSPFIRGAPTNNINNHDYLLHHTSLKKNDDVLLNENSLIAEQDIQFEGLLGCKYDSNICNRYEVCFDDALFGQCWDGKGSLRQAFAFEDGIDGLADNKLTALEYTFDILNRYHLDWKDYMTQCILSHILSNDHQHQLNRHRLELFYEDCLNKDELLNNVAAILEETKADRRQTNDDYNFHDYDSYAPLLRSKFLFLELDTPLFTPIKGQTRLPSRVIQTIPEKDVHPGSEHGVRVEKPTETITNESAMKEPMKLSMTMKERHPSLVETLQINNNKQSLPMLSEEIMANKILTNKDKTLNDTDGQRYLTVETTRGYIVINRDFRDQIEGARLLALIAQINSWPAAIFTELNADRRVLTYHVLDNAYRINASSIASSVLKNEKFIRNQLGIYIIDSGIGNPSRGAQLSVERQNASRWAVITLVTCVLVVFIMGSFALFYYIQRNERLRNKFAEITRTSDSSTHDYQDSSRQRTLTQTTDQKPSMVHQVTPANTRVKHPSESSSSRSSTSSWNEEPVISVNMDIMTGHLILSYMEDHLRDRHRLEAEWQSLCAEEANEERAPCSHALAETNDKKNRYIDCLPYDQTRVRLENNDDGDYINASIIFDSNPKCKYIATQGPMANTTNAFWQMVWEQGSCVIVALARPIENGITMCHHYWPVEGSARFDDFEVNLVSEHIWSDDYVVRSFYLKNLQTMETRTVTQFHFLTWDELCNPPSTKSVLDFRRKVNKCFRGRSSPIIVHCNDGVGRTGTYILLDMVLNRIYKGAREINIAATLEHIRDQRAKMVKTKDQFQFVFVAVAEEVTYLLKALPQ